MSVCGPFPGQRQQVGAVLDLVDLVEDQQIGLTGLFRRDSQRQIVFIGLMTGIQHQTEHVNAPAGIGSNPVQPSVQRVVTTSVQAWRIDKHGLTAFITMYSHYPMARGLGFVGHNGDRGVHDPIEQG